MESGRSARRPRVRWERFSGVSVVLLSLFFQLLALVQFLLDRSRLLPVGRWELQFYLLLGISFFMSLLLPVVYRRPRGFAIAVLTKLTIILLVGIPMGGYIGIELSMLISMILELMYFLSPPASYLSAALVVVLSALVQVSFPAWDLVLPGGSLHDRLSLIAYAGIVLLLTGGMREMANRLAAAEVRNRELDRAIFQLSNANVGFQSYADREVARSKESERNRITREIHDSIGYCLTNITMMMEAAIKLSPPENRDLYELLVDAREEAKEGLAETRRSLRLLRERGEQRLQGIPSILRLTRAFERATGVQVRVEAGQSPMRFREEIDLALYRFIQEGLTNALKHGKASRVDIQFQQRDDGLMVHVRDNGIGAEEIKKGIGFLGMEERIERVGGEVRILRSADGFTISAWIPWKTMEGGTQ